ncbi:MAG: lipase [Cocleimonas sp.]|nr:lipase [Cocleimonas sp.]
MRLFLLKTLSIAVLLSACGGGSSKHDFTETEEPSKPISPHGPLFDPAIGKIPATNDLLFRGSLDGTLNIPNPDNNPVIAAVNQLDGFSTSLPITADFGMSLAPASLRLGDTLHVYEVTKNPQGAVTSIVRALTAADLIATPIGDKAETLALIPRLPLKESSSYLVVLTNGIKDLKGIAAQAPSVYSLVRSALPLTGSDFEALESLRQLVNNMEDMAASEGVDKNKIILSWSFTTQSTTAVLKQVANDAIASTPVIAATGKTTKDFVALLAGLADVSIGTLEIPYYLEAPSSNNPTASLTGYWKGVGGSILTRSNLSPVATSTLNVPVIMTLPNTASGKTKPAEGWPVIMYQHGITRNRLDMIGYADAMAQAGFAMIAIDLPLHGVEDASHFLHANNTAFTNDIEPTFDVDFVNNETGVVTPDGVIDASGDHFINLNSFLTSRDNVRQGVANLLVLRRSLENISDINADKVSLIAHSLGGIVAIPFLGVEDKSIPSSLITTGASISTILRDSVVFAPPIQAGLAAQGITGEAFHAFLLGTQWVLDSADPINFANAATQKHAIHLMEIIGDGGEVHLSDQVVPNLSTELLIKGLNATRASEVSNPISIGSPRVVKFIQGNHNSILDPTRGAPAGGSYLNVFLEMRSQLASFHLSEGKTVVISDLDIVLK